MDSMIAAAARALAMGDVLGALKRVSLRGDAPALALRGIAMAQLGDYAPSRKLLRKAARAFGPREPLSKARCVAADAEVALAMRELGGSSRALEAAIATLESHRDRANAMQARLTLARTQVLLGRLDEARASLAGIDVRGAPPALAAIAALTEAEVALRSLQVDAARSSLGRAAAAAAASQVPALMAEVGEARELLERPAARLHAPGGDRMLRLDEVEATLRSGALVLDACRHALRLGATAIPLARRPVLFTLARAMAEAGLEGASREDLIRIAFRARRQDETHRARLRVEVGRLRALVSGVATVEATGSGFALAPKRGRRLVVLLPPIEGDEAALLALLADGAAWSTSALALALGQSQRNVQRSLATLESQRRVRSVGNARAKRWLAPPIAGITTQLLLPPALPPG